METFKSFKSNLYNVNADSFADIALAVFRYQAVQNAPYHAFLQHLGVNVTDVRKIDDIPFMPISFFKSQTMMSGKWEPEVTFTSSGTTGAQTSRHPVRDLQFYLRHSKRCFEYFFGALTNYNFLALLPSYLERSGSSLIAMMDYFIQESRSPFSGFYLYDVDRLLRDIEATKTDARKTVVWGVSFALTDLVEQFSPDLSHCLIFETGGMKGRRKEMTRYELHEKLTRAFGVQQIYSEYGMTELLSQAYLLTNEGFQLPPWMSVTIRDLTDPFAKGLQSQTGGINVIDLANWNTISFIETEDLGRLHPNGSFEVLGRMDNSDVRGCNLLVG
ncbi:long-chain-fatty-acid--protein ligase [Pseudochryseolinea flava]|uniref:Acyl transferase n=1 Tax=Pseudochryseolinea flava TaxID=2059302 RepID=A0A364XWL4_9BACT|nr:acyl transferase [Pseudochryseolinea flava]RAV98602.1 acyl transferase [Pseudochryseolinea flava]